MPAELSAPLFERLGRAVNREMVDKFNGVVVFIIDGDEWTVRFLAWAVRRSRGVRGQCIVLRRWSENKRRGSSSALRTDADVVPPIRIR